MKNKAPRIRTANHSIEGIDEVVRFTVDWDNLTDCAFTGTRIYMPSVNIIMEEEAFNPEEMQIIEAYRMEHLGELEAELTQDADNKYWDFQLYNRLTA